MQASTSHARPNSRMCEQARGRATQESGFSRSEKRSALFWANRQLVQAGAVSGPAGPIGLRPTPGQTSRHARRTSTTCETRGRPGSKRTRRARQRQVFVAAAVDSLHVNDALRQRKERLTPTRSQVAEGLDEGKNLREAEDRSGSHSTSKISFEGRPPGDRHRQVQHRLGRPPDRCSGQAIASPRPRGEESEPGHGALALCMGFSLVSGKRQHRSGRK